VESWLPSAIVFVIAPRRPLGREMPHSVKRVGGVMFIACAVGNGVAALGFSTRKKMNELMLDILPPCFEATDESEAKTHALANRMVIAGTHYIENCRDLNPSPLSVVVVVYNDIHAALLAADAVEHLVPQFRDWGCERLLPVPVDQLQDPDRFDCFLIEAHSADMIIVSFNGAGDFPESLKKWIENCLLQQREGHAAVVALLSSNKEWDPPDSPRYQLFKNAAWAAGLAFIPPLAEPAVETGGGGVAKFIY